MGRHYDPDLWLDRFAARLRAEAPARAVVDDLRLAREGAFLRQLGFACVLVTRPPELVTTAAGDGGTGDHETETEIDRLEAEARIANAGTFEELYARLDRLVAELGAVPA